MLDVLYTTEKQNTRPKPPPPFPARLCTAVVPSGGGKLDVNNAKRPQPPPPSRPPTFCPPPPSRPLLPEIQTRKPAARRPPHRSHRPPVRLHHSATRAHRPDPPVATTVRPPAEGAQFCQSCPPLNPRHAPVQPRGTRTGGKAKARHKKIITEREPWSVECHLGRWTPRHGPVAAPQSVPPPSSPPTPPFFH